MFMADGKIRYLGALSGLSKAVDYHEVKLPAEDIVARAQARPASARAADPAGCGSGREPKQLPPRWCNSKTWRLATRLDVEVLHGINLEIRRGRCHRGAGAERRRQDHLRQACHRPVEAEHGRVLVDGRDTKEASVAQIASTLGYVFQSPSHMLFAPTVHEELAFGPTNLKHPKDQIEEEVKEALKIVNLSEKEQDPPLALSFGQQKRVSIAAILAMRSRILVMDEPTAGQDYQNYMNFMDSILQLPGLRGHPVHHA